MNTYKILWLSISLLLCGATECFAEQLPQSTVTGILQAREDEHSSWIVIVTPEPLRMTNEYGETVSTNELQLAGLSEKEWERAAGLMNLKVRAEGSLMSAHTRYHKTEILLLTDRVDPL